ncbi:MAG: hypothetical protein QOF02_2209 [Blastocatellia bacterium]|nr:hypothetical protein [Blastocatellia bacterium]
MKKANGNPQELPAAVPQFPVPEFQREPGEIHLMRRTDSNAMPLTNQTSAPKRDSRAFKALLAAAPRALRRSTRRALLAVSLVRRSLDRLAQSVARRHTRAGQRAVALLLIFTLYLQPTLTLRAATLSAPATRSALPAPDNSQAQTPASLNGNSLAGNIYDALSSSLATPLAPEPVPVASITDAAVSIHHPTLNAGRIEGSLRVFSGESYAINSPFQLTGDLYSVGTPQIRLNSGASYGGTISDGGAVSPSNYMITFNSNLVLPGKIHTRADAMPLPTDIPTSVPAAAGTRTVNINTANDVASIGNWATVRDLNVTPANLVINVPPGNYNNFTVNSASRLNFVAGTYNFSGTINLNGGASIQTTGKVNINIGQAFNLNQGFIIPGANTLPGDVHLNAISTGGCNLNGTSQVTALIRCPNSTFNLNGTSPNVTGQVIASYLNINTGKITGNASITPPPDTTQPSVSITAPANNATTTAATINVTGAASDPGQYPSGIAQVTVNNAQATYNATAGTWTINNVALNIGANTITARAVDVAGNFSTQSINITRQQPPDTVAPALSISAPANNSTTANATINVSGTVSDTGQYASGVSQVTVNGTAATLNAAAGTWNLDNFPLNVGSNQLNVRAVDVAGNEKLQSVTVTRENPVDTTAPTLSITSPADATTTQDAAVTVSGTVSDTGQYASGVAQVMVNDNPATLQPSNGSWTISNVALSVGVNTITVKATDHAGNLTTRSLTITRQPPPDTIAPTLVITSPADNTTTQDVSIELSGTVSDAEQYASGVAQVTGNGAAATLDMTAGTWRITSVALNVGSNTINVRATDNAGNATTLSVHVTRQPPADTTAPSLSITSPADGSTTQAETTNISGTTSDPGDYASGVAQITVNGNAATLDAASGSWSLDGLQLNVGSNSFTARAVDHAGNATTKSINITREPPPDTVAPALSINAPADGSTTQEETVAVSGTAYDPGQYASGVAQVTVNGTATAFNAQAGTWTLNSLALNIGANPINVRAVDTAGNATTHSITVNRIPPPDTLAPTVNIASPLNNFVSPDASITVTGTAADDGPYATGVKRVVVNGQPASYDASTHIWTANDVQLEEGVNTINVFAEDNAPTLNRGEASINVTRHTPDTAAPTVVITSPLSSLDTYDATVSVTGTAVDEGLNATGIQHVTVNGRDASYNSNTHEWSIAGLPLAYGDNDILVVATDGATAPNRGQANVHVTRVRIPAPTLNLTNPQNGAVIASTTVTVAGSISSLSTEPLTVAINGESVPVSGGQFAKAIALAEGSNTITVVVTDALGQQTQSSLSVIRDLTAPSVSFVNVPASVQPGGTYQITVDATDNIGVADVELRMNGQHVATATAAPYQFSLSIPATYAAGNLLSLSAVARDLSNTTAVATAQTRTSGPGGISGYVFDDSTGYVLQSAKALLGSSESAETDETGAFNLVSSSPTGVARLTKDGYTPVERTYSVSIGEGTALFDARLTPLDAQANQIGVGGGTAHGDSGRLQVSFNAGAFNEQTDVRVTSVSPQGLLNLLPYGWSPVPGAVVDVRSANAQATTMALQSTAHLSITQVPNLSTATPLVLARYDEATHGWVALNINLFAGASGALTADLPKMGQYAFLVADTGATAPPPATANQPLTAGQPADSAALDSAQATAVATPRTAVYSAQARSTVSFVAGALNQLPSGVSIEATFGETYNLLAGNDSLLVDRPSQDFVLYSYPAASVEQPNRLAAFFVAKPTRTDFNLTDLLGANVHVEIRSGRQAKLGVLIDNHGGDLRASDGSQLTIPANSVQTPQSIFFNDVQPEMANVRLPEGYEVVAAFDVDLTSATLSNGATISVPGINGDLSRIVVARLMTVSGQRSPKVVARATQSGGLLVSTTSAPTVPAGVSLGGITTSGRYVFIRIPQAFGYLKGVVSDSSTNGPAATVRVAGNQTPFIDVTGASGQFLIIGSAGTDAAGANQLGAAALTTDATGRTNAALAAQDAVTSANISLAAVPLQVESVTPAPNAQNMIATTAITVSFNKPVAAATITGSNFALTTSNGNPVLGAITVLAGNRVAVFTPAATLAGSTSYRINVTQAVRDIYGKPLAAAYTSTFTTANVVRVDDRLKPEQIKINYPDQAGMSKILIPAQSVPSGSSIVAINNGNGSTISAVAGTAAIEILIPAQVGDEIVLIIRQPDGTEYRVAQAAYRRADGFVSVSSNGGTITSDDGQLLISVPAGAITGQANIKLSPRVEADIQIPREGEMDPSNVPFAGGIRMDVSGQFSNQKELHLELPAPPGAVAGQPLVFMKPAKLNEGGQERDVWEVVTSGKVEDGKLKTMSPPFYGVTIASNLGPYDFFSFMPYHVRAVTGIVTERAPGNQAPKPLANVVCVVSAGGSIPSVIARTAANGRFGLIDYALGSAASVDVKATDILNRTKIATATPYLNINPITEHGLMGLSTMFAAVEFPSSDGLPETLPALLRMEGRMLDLEDGQPDTLQAVGRVLVNSHLEIKTTATPDVQQITGQLLVGGSLVKQLVWTRSGQTPGEYVTDLRIDAEGSYSVVVTTHTLSNIETTKATKTFGFVAQRNPNIRSRQEGPPRVLSVTPANLAQAVSTGSRVHLEFNEPVKNLVPGQTIYVTDVATGQHIGGTITSGGLPIGPNSDDISNIDLQPSPSLEGNKQFAVEVTTDVKDLDDTGLDQEYTSPEDTSHQPFRSTFTTFSPLVLTDPPPTTDSYRVAMTEDLAITVTPDMGSGSIMHIWNTADPQTPKFVKNQFVPNYAVAYDIAEIEHDEDMIKVERPTRQSYKTIAVVASYSPRDTARPINLFIYSLDVPEFPRMIGVVSLNISESLPAYPSYIKILHKRAYIGNSGRGGVAVVDLQEAATKFAADPQFSWFRATLPNGGYDQEALKQRAPYGHSVNEASPVYSISLMDQEVAAAGGGGALKAPVGYVTSNKPQLISFDFSPNLYDNRTAFYDGDNSGYDDRVLAVKDLAPAGIAQDVRAVPSINLSGHATDMAVLLGSDRLWIFDVTDPRDPHQYPSRSFADMGLGVDFARRMDVEDTLCYVMFTDRVAVIDFSDPARPFLSATITGIGSGLRWLSVKDGFVYTLDPTGSTVTANLRVSVGSTAAIVYVHGKSLSDPESKCTNPVLLSRDNNMVQDAETIFKVYGHDAPRTAKVIYRKEIRSGDQTIVEKLAEVQATIKTGGPSSIVEGRAPWRNTAPINRAALYTAELVIDEGQPTEFRARHVEVPFSYLIDQYKDEWGIPQSGGAGYLPYLLGGDAIVHLMIKDQNGAFQNIELRPDANNSIGGDTGFRGYGFHNEKVPRYLPGLNNIPAGRYFFRLTAALNDSTSIVENAEGFVTIGETRKDVRLPGSTVAGDVELESGNLALTHPDIPEIKNRGLSLSFTRYYNSADTSSFNPLGYAWRHNYQVLLVHDASGLAVNPGDVAGPHYMLIGGEGSGQQFKEAEVDSGAEAHAHAPYQGILHKNSDGTFDYFTRNRIKYHFNQLVEGDSTILFNLGYMGNLSYIEEPNGNRITLSYDGDGRLFTVADSAGRKLQFTYAQALTPMIGTVDMGAVNGQITNCNDRRFMRSLRQRFLQADIGVAWHITNIKGPGGLEVNYEYDGNGNLQRVRRSGVDQISESTNESIWEYAYNPTEGATTVNPNLNHLITKAKSPNSVVIPSSVTNYEYELSQSERPIKTVSRAENVSYGYAFTYTNGRITEATVTDPRDNPTRYQFVNHDPQGTADPSLLAKTVTIMAPRSAQSVVTFDGYGHHLSEADPEGLTVSYRYENGNAVERTTSGGVLTQRTTATYDPVFNKLTSFTDANRKTIGYTVNNRNGNVTEIRLPTGRSVTMDYNPNSDLLRMTDQYGFATSFKDYDAYGNPQTITRQTSGDESVVKHQTFDERSRLKSVSDDLGPSEAYAYDALDRMIRQTITDPTTFHDSMNVSMTYLPEGQLKSMTQAGGTQQMTVVNDYDGLGRMKETKETPSDAGEFIRPFVYDRNSNLTEETDRRGVKRTRVYDALNFPTSETLSGPNGATLNTMSAPEVDKVGNPKRVVNLYGQEIRLDYDGLHRLSVRHLPGGTYKEEFGYDDIGNITSTKDRNGRETAIVYDAINRRKELRDPAGRVTTWSYDDAQRMVTMQQALQGLLEITKEDALGRLLLRETRFGSTVYKTTIAYDGRTVTTKDARDTVSVRELSAFNETGRLTINGASPAYVVEMRYGAMGGLAKSKDALNRETVYTLDGLNHATGVSYPGGFSEQFTYDGEGLMLSHKDRRGVESTMTYDNLQRELTTRVKDGQQTINVSTITYNDAQHTETRTDANNHATVFDFDPLHRVQTLTNADNKSKSFVYDGMDLRRESDFQSRFTDYEYDEVGRLRLVKDRKSQITNIVNSDNGGYTKQITDRRGNLRVESYDPLGRLTSVTDGGELLSRFEYDGNSNRTLMADGLNNPTTYTYDALNRVKTINHANTQTETFTYDSVGNARTYNDGRGADVRMDYDELNHPRSRTDGEGNPTATRYDGEGLLLEKTDPKGAAYKTLYEYNALGSLKKITDAKSGIWEFTYDDAQNLKAVKDALNHTVAYDYDALNRVRQTTQPQNLITTYGYDADGNRNSITDPKSQQTTIVHDELDRPQSLSYSNTSGAAGPLGYTFGYDPESNLTSVEERLDASTKRAYARSYDARDRLKTTTDPFNRTVTYGYDAANNLTSLKDSQQKQTSYSYDAHNRLQTVTMPNGSATYTWHADGLLQSVDYGSDMRREYAYDNADRLTQVTNTIGSGAQAQTQQFVYTYDANSNRETETKKLNGQAARTNAYAYDLLDRLTNASYAAPGQPRPANPAAGQTASYTDSSTHITGFGYDAAGNRLTATAQDRVKTVTLSTSEQGVTTESSQTTDSPLSTSTSQFDALNRLTNLTTGSDQYVYSYDNNGNLSSVKQNGQPAVSYEHDCRDQLRRIVNGAGQETASYDYDFERHRLSKKVGANLTEYVYGAGQVVNEYGANNQFLNRYVMGAGEIIRSEFGGEGERYNFTDALGSVTALAQRGSTSSLTASYEYDAWGAAMGSSGSSVNAIGYTGQRVDSESGLMPLGNGERYYAPNMGNFIQQDSLAGGVDEPASLNRYAYAQGNPNSFTDPSGHIPILIPFLIALAIGVAISSYEQNSEIRAGTRRPQDYSLSEALVNYTPVGGAYRTFTASDPVTLEQLSVKRWVFEATMLAMDFAPALEALQPLARLGRIGRSTAEVIEEGSHLANTTRRALTTTAEIVSKEKGALTALEEATHLRSGVSKAEQAAEEVIEASRSGRRVEDFMEAARQRIAETRARYGFNEATDNIVGMSRKAEGEAANLAEEASALERANPEDIRFSQDTANPIFSDGRNINDTIAELKARPGLAEEITPIKVFEQNGNLWSLDNRRLLAYQSAGIKEIPITRVSLSDPKIFKEYLKKFKPIEGGRKIVVVPKAGKAEARRLLRQYGKYSKD